MSGASFSGTVTYADGSSDSLVTTYDADFGNAPTLMDIAGSYDGIFYPSGNKGSAMIDGTGNLSGRVGSCMFSGTVVPRSVGNVFDVDVVEDQATCGTANRYHGVAYLDRSLARPLLKLAVLNSQRTKGVVFTGVLPVT